MNKKIATLVLASLMLTASGLSLATDKAGSAAPPTAIPGVNQSSSKPESNEEKANKKGEEASGSNSGAASKETEKDAATSSDSEDIQSKPKQ
ncbi:hypothetical protein [Pseudomonas sp. H1h]|uniref:hypothetical protein n=1 Tax=Pseudomonas sp. H1h TaxID=1397280 RepID=UPI0004682BEE|nr:hypothetical protein [Pseudomonas sp. H1h]